MGAIIAELVDTGEQRDALGRRRTPVDRRVQLVQAFKRSGLTMASFAAREGVTYTTFSGWVQRLRRDGAVRRRPVRFAEVKFPVPVQAAGLEVRLPDGTVLRGGSAVELAALVRALKG
jgi:transposase-like protein